MMMVTMLNSVINYEHGYWSINSSHLILQYIYFARRNATVDIIGPWWTKVCVTLHFLLVNTFNFLGFQNSRL